MLRFNTHIPSELASFLQSLRSVFITKNQDIRTIGTGKLLHAAGEAQSLNSWQQLISVLEESNAPVNAESNSSNDNQEEIKKNESALEEIMALCDKEKSGEDYVAGDLFYASNVATIDVTIAISSSTKLIITVDSECDFIAAKVRSAGFGKVAITELSYDQLEALKPVVLGQVMSALSELDFDWDN